MRVTRLIIFLFFIGTLFSCGSSDKPEVITPIDETEIIPPDNTPILSVKSDDFSGDGALLNFVTNNADSLPQVSRVSGRYYANLINNSNDITLHFNNKQGRLDAKLLSFPFEFIARNIGIGVQNNSQVLLPSNGNSYVFSGIQVHVTDLQSRNSSHIVVGHRGGTRFTLEGKNTVNGSSTVDDMGEGIAPLGRADLRILGNEDNTITVYWQLPQQETDNWILYDGYNSSNGKMPGQSPGYGDQVYVGLITYAQGSANIPFAGTCDAIEIYE